MILTLIRVRALRATINQVISVVDKRDGPICQSSITDNSTLPMSIRDSPTSRKFLPGKRQRSIEFSVFSIGYVSNVLIFCFDVHTVILIFSAGPRNDYCWLILSPVGTLWKPFFLMGVWDFLGLQVYKHFCSPTLFGA